MSNFKIYTFLTFVVLLYVDCRSAPEPLCSKFSYDEQLLEKMVRVEFNVNNMEKTMLETEKNMRETEKKMRKVELNMTETEKSMKETEQNMRKVELNMTETETSMKETERNMRKVELDMTETEKSMKETEKNMRKVELDMTETEKSIKETEKNLLKTQTNMLTTLSEIADKMKVLEQKEAALEALTGKDVIAFHAYKVADKSLVNKQVMVFTKVLMNEGDGYSSNNGYFTAPVNGIYYFNAHLCVNDGKSLQYIIVVEDQTQASGYYKPNGYGTCTSFSVTVRMRSGERAWVTIDASGSSSSSLLYEDSDDWNYFSGFLIRKTN